MKKFAVTLVALFCGLALNAHVAQADIFALGDNVNVKFLYPDTATIYNSETSNVVVSNGIEAPNFAAGNVNADLSLNTIGITFNVNATAATSSFNGFQFSDYTNTLADIIGVVVNPSTNISGYAITFDTNNIFVNLSGVNMTTSSVLSLSILSAPEPASMLAWGLIVGVGGLGYRLRKRKLAQA